MIDPSTIGFGVELETHISNTSPIYRAPWHSGRGSQPESVVPLYRGRHAWRCERDRSVACGAPAGRMDCEFISPVLYGEDGIEHLRAAIKRIKQHGARVNACCGVHIHVDFDADLKALSRLVHLVGCCEVGLYASSGSKRRETNGFCKSIKKRSGMNPRDRDPFYNKSPEQATADCRSERYHLINLRHYGGRASRVEFRVFSGSLNADKIVTWVRLVIAIVETALNGKRRHAWELKSYRQKRDNIGWATLYELLVRIGWIKLGSQTKPPTGLVGMEHGPDLEEMKKILKRLAKKYDGEGR